MKPQIIPMNSSAVLDDELIRIVNANHDRYVRQQQERLAQQEIERQIRWQKINRLLNGLICAALGSAVTIIWLTFML